MSVVGRQRDGPDDPKRPMGPAGPKSIPRTRAARRDGSRTLSGGWAWAELGPRARERGLELSLQDLAGVPRAHTGSHPHTRTAAGEEPWRSGTWALPPPASPPQSH